MPRLVSRFYLDLGGPEDCLLLAGSGRSGTTWVGDILNYDNSYRTLFEPFWRKEVPLVRHFRPRQYLRPDCTDPTYLEPARRILAGHVHNRFIDSLNTKWLARKRLVKDIRVPLLLSWIHAQFPSIPIVQLLRHPCAVALSAMKQGWQPPLDDMLEQEELWADHLEPHRETIERVRAEGHDFEKRILLWCIENRVALAADTGCVVYYERLCADDPRPEIARMFAHAGRPFDDRVFAMLSTPSRLSARDSAVVTGGNLIDGWRRKVETSDLDRALALLAEFGLDTHYGAGPAPVSP